MDDVVKILQTIQEDLSKQKQDMKEMEQSIKESINSNIDEKFNFIEIKTKLLESKIEQQQKTIEALDKQIRKKNVIFFGIEEKEKEYEGLLSIILHTINNRMQVPCQKFEIENVKRIGIKSEKVRPVVVTVTTTSRKIEILKKKKMLSNTNIYLKEDFPPSVLQKRKDLQEELKRERESGKIAVLRYDKIVILKTRESETRTPIEKNTNKRFLSTSPEDIEKEPTKYNISKSKQTLKKKNKSQNITSFLRPPQPNLINQLLPNDDTQKN